MFQRRIFKLKLKVWIYIFIFLIFGIIFYSFLRANESYEKIDLEYWNTDKLFVSNKDKDQKLIPYDIISDVYYVNSLNNVYNMSDFDSNYIEKVYQDPSTKAPNGPRNQSSLTL